jgi:hypothetical protein
MPGGAPLRNHNHLKHGLSHTRIDNIYRSMIARCYKKTDMNYHNYGERGISICDEWKNDKQSFFRWAFENGYSDDLTLDRIDVNGNYSPENCRWATYLTQANNKRNNRLININGEIHTMADWSRVSGVKKATIFDRIKKGWPEEQAVFTKVRHGSKTKNSTGESHRKTE